MAKQVAGRSRWRRRLPPSLPSTAYHQTATGLPTWTLCIRDSRIPAIARCRQATLRCRRPGQATALTTACRHCPTFPAIPCCPITITLTFASRWYRSSGTNVTWPMFSCFPPMTAVVCRRYAWEISTLAPSCEPARRCWSGHRLCLPAERQSNFCKCMNVDCTLAWPLLSSRHSNTVLVVGVRQLVCSADSLYFD